MSSTVLSEVKCPMTFSDVIVAFCDAVRSIDAQARTDEFLSLLKLTCLVSRNVACCLDSVLEIQGLAAKELGPVPG